MDTLSSFIKSSNELYTVHSDGTVMDSTSTILEPVLINDEPHVHLDWYDGSRNYKLSLIMVVTFLDLHPNISERHWNFIISSFTTSEFSMDCLYYYFSEPIPRTLNKYFYHIPGFTHYVLNREGILISLRTGKVCK